MKRTSGIRKDGSCVSLAFSMMLLFYEAGDMKSCAAVMRELTERWKKEKELNERLATCEAKSIV